MKKSIPLIIILVVLLFVVVFGSSSMVVTNENEYTLVKQFGKIDRIIDTAGLSFRIPFVETTSTIPQEILLYN